MALPTTMTRVVVTAYNLADPPASLAVETSAPVPSFGHADVLVKVVARPVNPADVFSLQARAVLRPRVNDEGVYPGFAPAELPAVPGLEGAGVVVAAGADSGVAVGTRAVVFFDAKSGNGSWQEFFVNPVTVIGMLDVLSPPPGAYVLQSAGGSTLCRLFAQAAAKRGVKVISVVRREAQKAELLAAGHAAVIAESEDIAARVREVTGGELAWGATDSLAGGMSARLASAVRGGGTVVVYGAMNGFSVDNLSVGDLLFRGVSVCGFWLMPWLKTLAAERRAEVFATIVAWLADGTMTPHTGEEVPLAEAARAVALSVTPARGGKVILVSPEK